MSSLYDAWMAPEMPMIHKIQKISDPYLTLGLIAGAVVLVVVALKSPTAVKAIVLAWIILP